MDRFSPTHRNKVMLVMDLFKEQGVIDELGLGTIRDSLSDILSPEHQLYKQEQSTFYSFLGFLQDIESRGKFDRFSLN
ncbi:MAG: hypothetical protein IPL04_08635 [Chitinophagaceae bacterium]|nr:hypothetical protein [Chitinophagaceae bacterium]